MSSDGAITRPQAAPPTIAAIFRGCEGGVAAGMRRLRHPTNTVSEVDAGPTQISSRRRPQRVWAVTWAFSKEPSLS